MSIVTIDLETGDMTQFSNIWENSSGGISASALAKRSGNWGALLDHQTDGAYCSAGKNFTPAGSEVWARIYFLLKSDVDFSPYGTMLAITLYDNVNLWSANAISSTGVGNSLATHGWPDRFWSGGSGIAGEGDAYSFDAETWYCLEVYWKKHASAGAYKAWVNGSIIVDQSGLNTDTYSLAMINFGNQGSTPYTNCNFYMDDIVISDEGYIGPSGNESKLKANIVGGNLRLMLKSFSI